MQPWDDETDMAKLEESVRSIQADGLLWGASKLVAVGYGIKKLQIKYDVVVIYHAESYPAQLHCRG